MEIQDIKGRRVKVGKTSITVKDEQDKTRGIVRNIRKFNDIPMNRQVEAFGMLKKIGIWGSGINGLLDCVILDGNKFYFLNNTRPLVSYQKYFAGLGCEAEEKRYNQRLQIAEEAAKYMTVIDCELL